MDVNNSGSKGFFDVVQAARQKSAQCEATDTDVMELQRLSSSNEQSCLQLPTVKSHPCSNVNTETTTSIGRFRYACRQVQGSTMQFLGLTIESSDYRRWQHQRIRLTTRNDCNEPTAKQYLDKQKRARERWQSAIHNQRLLIRATGSYRQRTADKVDGSDHNELPNEESFDLSDDELIHAPTKTSVAALTFKGLSKAIVNLKAARETKDTSRDNVDAVEISNQRAISSKSEGRAEKFGFRNWLSKKSALEDSIFDYRPYFTYWVSTVQLIVLIISLFLYPPLAPYGFGLKKIEGEVLTTSLSRELIGFEEPAFLWIGPRQSVLVALGAKYTPCMRPVAEIQEGIKRQRVIEETTGCCIRDDQSGCVQIVQEQCSPSLSRWDKWDISNPGPEGRLSGPVCGEDPRFCTAPASVAPNVWPDDITKWPLCLNSNTTEAALTAASIKRDTSYTCEVVGRPCCVGIHGECHITTREHCDLLYGSFHEEAALCAQVSCLADVCRMMPFLNPEVPDQIYRLWMSIFIHPGVGPFVFTMIVHVFLLRNLEKFAGVVRISIIYILSGITGNLASAVFVPNRPEAGPSGSLAGVVGCLFVVFVTDILEEVRMYWRTLITWLLVILFAAAIGTLPGIDNYALIFGFIMGILSSLVLIPHIGHNMKQRGKGQSQQFATNSSTVEADIDSDLTKRRPLFCRCIIVLTSLGLIVGLLTILFILLYVVPFNCSWCGYIDCIPYTQDFCAEQQTSFARHRIVT